MRSWSEPDLAPDDSRHPADRGVGGPVEFVASIIENIFSEKTPSHTRFISLHILRGSWAEHGLGLGPGALDGESGC